MKLPVIKGREVVPVRLIPVLTHNEFGPQTLSGILANRLRVDGFPANPAFDSVEVVIDGEITRVPSAEIVTRTLKDISASAYHLNEAGKPVKMLSIEWDDIYHNISALEKQIRRRDEHGDVEHLLRSEWQREATNLLPPGTFLWRDDLDALWRYHFSFYSKWEGEHPELRILNYDAYVRPEERSIYLQGFEAHITKQDGAVDSKTATEKQLASQLPEGRPSGSDPGLLIQRPVPTPAPVEFMDIPLPPPDDKPVKQYPGRLTGKQYQNLSIDEYIQCRLRDTPPASDAQLVYELRGETEAINLAQKLKTAGRLTHVNDLKSKVARLFKSEAERLGTADDVIKGRQKSSVAGEAK